MDFEKKYVTYEEFGAKGDGYTDDMPAIVACHEYANQYGYDVFGKDGATYYIGGKNLTAVIKTNVFWGKAKFILDDRNLENIHQVCFDVVSDAESFVPVISSLSSGTHKLDIGRSGSFFVRVADETRSVYIRKGLNKNSGNPAYDCFVVGTDGSITGNINWDYKTVTHVSAKSVDDLPLTVDGGIFTTIANNAPSFYNYHSRNIRITRSHVTVKNLTHLVTGEGDHGAPYSGFLSIEACYDTTLKDCLLTPHFTYMTESKEPGKLVAMGSYDINISAAIDVRLINLKQTIDISDRRYWGLMGSNGSKKFYMENCEISRYDAHTGVTDCVIKACRLGHMGTNLIGFGECVIEDTVFICSRTVALRTDYGSTFKGTLTMKNCVWYPAPVGEKKKLDMITANNTGDHDFGYKCYMPEKIIIDGLVIDDEHIDNEDLFYSILPSYDASYEPNKPFPYVTAKTLILKNVYSKKGREIVACTDKLLYPDLDVIYE